MPCILFCLTLKFKRCMLTFNQCFCLTLSNPDGITIVFHRIPQCKPALPVITEISLALNNNISSALMIYMYVLQDIVFQ